MRWKDREESSNIEDRRGMSGGGKAGLGLGGVVLIVAIALATGQDPLKLLGQVTEQVPLSSGEKHVPTEREEELKKFTGVVLKDTETVWTAIFKKAGKRYIEPKLVMFTGHVQSGCGAADAGMGPFYCGNDQMVYIDLSFYDMLQQRFGAGGDFAQAYVIAHEVGHHVQKLTGVLDKVHSLRENMSEKQANSLSVRLELQADYYAGVWAHHAKEMESLTEDDLNSALNAANAIGDDAIQKKSQGYVVPDAFTHGTSVQRKRWFMKGWHSGEISGGDTFSVREP